MDLIDIIYKVLIVFSVLLSIVLLVSYIAYKIKHRPVKQNYVQNIPVQHTYPMNNNVQPEAQPAVRKEVKKKPRYEIINQRYRN